MPGDKSRSYQATIGELVDLSDGDDDEASVPAGVAPRPAPGPTPVPSPGSIPEPFLLEPPNSLMTKGMTGKLDLIKLADNLWAYMSNYEPEWRDFTPPIQPKWDIEIFTQLLEKGLEVLDKQELVQVIPKGPYTIIGALEGHGDSLTSLLSIIPSIKGRKLIFLGNYFGLGFASLEVFAFVLTLKCLYPDNIFMLRGAHEDKSALDDLGLEQLMDRRFVCKIVPSGPENQPIQYLTPDGKEELSREAFVLYQDQCEDIEDLLEELLGELSLAALLDGNVVCMYGGPGPTLQTYGMKLLYQMEKGETRSEREAQAITECLWACMKEDESEDYGMPTFSVEQVKKFNEAENIRLLVRGRQLAGKGVLNNPLNVLTLTSVLCFLDQYSNDACALSIDGKRLRIHRIEMMEEEQRTDDMVKMGLGRNSLDLLG